VNLGSVHICWKCSLLMLLWQKWMVMGSSEVGDFLGVLLDCLKNLFIALMMF
jgi:hypothetical protein